MAEFKYTLSIAAIMKNEELNVLEWIAYHHICGVEHFYIYVNDDDPTKMNKVLKQYVDSGIVTLNHAPGPVMMFKCYNDVIANYKNESKLIAFLDADEFLVPIEDTNVATLADSLISRYKENSDLVSGLAVKWATYGSSYFQTRPKGLVIENYLYRENRDLDRHVKSIVDPRRVSNWINPHFPVYSNGFYSVDETGLKSFGPFLDGDKRNKLRINHYYYKSEEEFRNRIFKGKCDIHINEGQMINKINSEMPNFYTSNNQFDTLMLRYINRVESEMSRFS